MPKEKKQYVDQTLGAQETPIELMAFYTEYGIKNYIQADYSEFNNEDQERFGFDPDIADDQDGPKNQNERQYNLDFYEKNVSDLDPAKYFELVDQVARLQVRKTMELGLDLQMIRDSLEGEELQEDKAVYLFKEGRFLSKLSNFKDVHSTLMQKFYKPMTQYYESVINENTTLKDLYDLNGFDEADREKFEKLLGGKEDEKILDVAKRNYPCKKAWVILSLYVKTRWGIQ